MNGGYGDQKLSTGAKVWCIFCIAANAIVGILSIVSGATFAGVLSLALVAGFVILLTGNKIGFFVVCGCAVLTMIVNLFSGNILAAVFGFLNPLITWALIRNLIAK